MFVCLELLLPFRKVHHYESEPAQSSRQAAEGWGHVFIKGAEYETNMENNVFVSVVPSQQFSRGVLSSSDTPSPALGWPVQASSG